MPVVFNLPRFLEHPLDARHLNHIEGQRTSADRIDPVLAVAFTEPQQALRLPQLHSVQRPPEQPLAERSYVASLLLGAADKGVHIPERMPLANSLSGLRSAGPIILAIRGPLILAKSLKPGPLILAAGKVTTMGVHNLLADP